MYDFRRYDGILWLVVFIVCMVACSAVWAEGVNVGPNCTASWTASPGATGYRVYVGSTSTSKTQRAQVTTTTVPCSTLALTAGQQYAHVTAINVAGESSGSNTVAFVLVGVPAAPTGLVLSPD